MKKPNRAAGYLWCLINSPTDVPSIDEKTFDDLFRTWYEPLVRYALGFTNGDADEAEDLVQQVFAHLWQRRESIGFEQSTKAYLYKMTHNRALNRLRSEGVKSRFAEHQLRAAPVGAAPPDAAGELEKRYHETLAGLPPQCRQVFELSRFEELKYREIGDQLGISVKTVEMHMGKALRVLRRELAEFLAAVIWLTVNGLGQNFF